MLMKSVALFLLINLCLFSQAQNYYLPEPKGYVSDYEDLFTPQQEDSLRVAIAKYEQQTTNEIVIVTIPRDMLEDDNLEDYTLFLLRTWGVGKVKKNNGILIGICTSLRSIQIQNGYGIEKVFTDTQTKEVIAKDILPFFRYAKYFEGTYKGLMTIMKQVPAL